MNGYQSVWWRIAIFMSAAALVRASYYMARVVILAALGLAGMWMLHTLAQDFNYVRRGLTSLPSSISTSQESVESSQSYLVKRSIGNIPIFETAFPFFNNLAGQRQQMPQIKNVTKNWEMIVNRDPQGCARSFICQLASAGQNTLLPQEQNVIDFIRSSLDSSSYAGKEVQLAMRIGRESHDGKMCVKHYRCPFSKQTMVFLLQMISGGSPTLS